MSFGARLTQARKAKGLTQQELGKGLATGGEDASKSVVYGWEKDQHYPRVDQLGLICERLGCSADFLLFGRVSESALPAEVAGLVDELMALPGKQRDWVLMTLREAVKLAKETVTDRPKDEHHSGLSNSPSPKRRAA